MQDALIKGFKAYLRLEKSLAENSVEAYLRDVKLLQSYVSLDTTLVNSLSKVKLNHLEGFIAYLNDLGLNDRSQARVISGLKAFYKYLKLEDIIEDSPAALLEGPKLSKKLPDTLSHDEIEAMIATLDLSKGHHVRNKAILETLYSCGLRVSELTSLKISNLFFDIEVIKVIGKGNKERLVPIGSAAIKYITIYLENVRNHLDIKAQFTDTVFLNKHGKSISRIMIFNIIKEAAKAAGINKNVSPHTLRHSFATELINNGANLKAVQQMLGHASITTTEIYTHLDQSYLRDTMVQFHPRFK